MDASEISNGTSGMIGEDSFLTEFIPLVLTSNHSKTISMKKNQYETKNQEWIKHCKWFKCHRCKNLQFCNPYVGQKFTECENCNEIYAIGDVRIFDKKEDARNFK